VKRLVISGSVCSHPDIYDIIENSGGVVVGDDLCTGYRYFEGMMDEKKPPLKAITGGTWSGSSAPPSTSSSKDAARTSSDG